MSSTSFPVFSPCFPNHQGPLDPQWLLVLVLDVRTDTACFMWGYELDPYVEPDLINNPS